MRNATNMINVSVIDSFEIKAGTPGSAHVPGTVVIIDGRQCGFLLPKLDETIEMLRPDGRTIEARVDEIKEHGEGRSFFFSLLHQDEVPVGTVLTWRDINDELDRTEAKMMRDHPAA